ncbi:MAG TPA: hypothetical protein VHD62_01660 [Opitutaceae bacterium]|nr:hypothetical protein [Opitutaceae bacterium]
MNDDPSIPPPAPPPLSNSPGEPPPPTDAGSQPPVSRFDAGCNFVAGTIGGFILFVIAGAGALSLGRNGSFGVAYLVVAFIAAIALATQRSLRGLAVGIFLGLGCVLLLIAICSGFRIN